MSIYDLLGKWQSIDSPEKQRASSEENLSDLNNEGHEEVTEDFSDSPHADRIEVTDEGELVDSSDLSPEGVETASASD